MAVGLLVLVYRRTRPGRHRCIVAWCAAILAAGAVGWSRVYLGMHWPTDVAGGWAFGALWVSLLALLGLGRPPPPTAERRYPHGAPDRRGCRNRAITSGTGWLIASTTPRGKPGQAGW